MESIFSKIIRKEIPADIVFENDKIIAIKDIHPVAPVHLLIIPKVEYKDLQSIPPEDLIILGEVGHVAQLLAKQFDITQGYRLLSNNGSAAGQTVFHLHFHLIGGRHLGALG